MFPVLLAVIEILPVRIQLESSTIQFLLAIMIRELSNSIIFCNNWIKELSNSIISSQSKSGNILKQHYVIFSNFKLFFPKPLRWYIDLQ